MCQSPCINPSVAGHQVIVVVAAFPGLAPQKHKTGLPCNKAEAVFLPLLVPDSISDVRQLQICGVVDWCYDCVYQPLGQVEVKQPHVFISRVHVSTALTAAQRKKARASDVLSGSTAVTAVSRDRFARSTTRRAKVGKAS